MSRDPMNDILDVAGELFRSSFRQVDIEEFFADREIPLADGNSKRTFARNTLASLPGEQALELILEVAASQSNHGLQDAVYAIQDAGKPEISEITRKRLAGVLGTRLHGEGARPEVLAGLFSLESFADLLTGESKHFDLVQNATGETPAWDAAYVFEFVGAMTCPTRRFISLLETTLDPRYRDAGEQAQLAEDLTPVLRTDGYEVIETGKISNRAVYAVRAIKRGVQGSPKNLIFASNGRKPRIGFADAIDNDIVVLEHAESCLIYDRHLGDGLLWSDLVRWWAETTRIEDLSVARKELGARLSASLTPGPELRFFAWYFKSFAQRLADRLPALVPQVYLHYDPEIAVNLPDRTALFRQRMDFLMLLPGRQRIVIEIDGKHHYAESGAASPAKYAEMVSADRDLRLRGYEVYRFGGSEFVAPDEEEQNRKANELVSNFFERLFKVHRLL